MSAPKVSFKKTPSAPPKVKFTGSGDTKKQGLASAEIDSVQRNTPAYVKPRTQPTVKTTPTVQAQQTITPPAVSKLPTQQTTIDKATAIANREYAGEAFGSGLVKSLLKTTKDSVTGTKAADMTALVNREPQTSAAKQKVAEASAYKPSISTNKVDRWKSVMTSEEKDTLKKVNDQYGEVAAERYVTNLNLDSRIRDIYGDAQKNTASTLERNVASAKKTESAAGRNIAFAITGDLKMLDGASRGEMARGEYTSVVPENLAQFLTAEQKSTMKAYAAAGDFKAVADYYNAIQMQLTEQNAAKQFNAAEQATANSGLRTAASAFETGALNAFGGIPAAGATASGMIRDFVTGEYHPIDYNSAAFAAVRRASALQTGATENIKKNLGKQMVDEDGNPVVDIYGNPVYEDTFLTKAAGTAYSGVSSGVTNMLQMATGSKLIGLTGNALQQFTLLTMGGSAAGSAAWENLKSGQSNGAALVNAAMSGAIEYMTETVPVAKFLENIGGAKAGRTAKEMMKGWFSQAGSEAWEEVVGNIAENVWDNLYNGPNSELNQLQRQYMETEGLDEETARKKAFMDLIVYQSLEAAASAALSTAFMGATTHAAVAAGYGKSGLAIKKQGSDAVQSEINLAGKLGTPNSMAVKQAEKIKKAAGVKTVNGVEVLEDVSKVSNRELGRLHHLNTIDIGNVAAAMMENEDTRDYGESILAQLESGVPLSSVQMAGIQAAITQREVGASTIEEQEAVTKAVTAQSKINVLDTATTAYVNAGVDLKTAQKMSETVNAIMNGETVSNNKIRDLKLDLPNTRFRTAFEAVTGISLGDTVFRGNGKFEELKAIVMSAAQRSAEQAAEQPTETPAQSAVDLQQIAAWQQENGFSDNADQIVDYETFAKFWRSGENPNASDAEIQANYKEYRDTVRTITLNGQEMNIKDLRNFLEKNLPEDAAKITDEEMHRLFDATAAGLAQGDVTSVEAVNNALQAIAENKAAEEAVLTEQKNLQAAAVANLNRGLAPYGYTVVMDYNLSGQENGYFDGKVIHLNGNTLTTERAMIFTLGHELTHAAPVQFSNDIISAFQTMLERGMLQGNLKSLVENMDAEIKETSDKYLAFLTEEHRNEYEKENGVGSFTLDMRDAYRQELLENGVPGTDQSWDEYIREEYAADLMRHIFSYDTDIISKLAAENSAPIDRSLSILRKMMQFFSKKDPQQAEMLQIMQDLESKMIKGLRDGRKGLDKRTADKRHSISTMFEAINLEVETKDGNRLLVIKDGNGNRVSEVTESMVRKSRLGAVLQASLDKGRITEEKMNQQIKFFVQFTNQLMKTQDIDMLFAISGSLGFQEVPVGTDIVSDAGRKSKFAGYTNNSDPQYNRTIDFTTICLKTQAVIDAMSSTMIKLDHGLTESEIVDIVYKNTHEAGEPVPCPVCYVFSRWVGLGGLFDNMANWQEMYADYSKEDIQKVIDGLQSKIQKIVGESIEDGEQYSEGKARTKLKNELTKQSRSIKAAALNAEKAEITAEKKALPNKSAIAKEGKAQGLTQEQIDERTVEIMDRKAELQRKLTQIRTNLKAANLDATDPADLNLSAEEQAELDALTADLMVLDQWSWLTQVRMQDNYEPVPHDVLFDINRGDEFANRYPASWKFRTTRGPAMGKAAAPYSPMHIGQVIKGAGLADISNIGDQSINNVLKSESGELTADAKKDLDRSSKAMKAQNLMNGQRFQSTSDFRFEYALDYLLAFIDLQAIGGKVQLYTKVPEAVGFLASMGAEVNCSLMPLGIGYNPETKDLLFSSVTGMNAEDAFNLANAYDNVQTIMVGTSDEHIRLCMVDDRIQFIIPYHASGASENRYKSMMDTVAESVEHRDDYSAYQTDKKIDTDDPKILDARSARKKILTGNAAMLTESERDNIRRLKDSGNDILWELHKRFTGRTIDGKVEPLNQKYLEPSQRSADPVYYDENCLHISLNDNGEVISVDPVKMSGAAADMIFPFEYWDKTLTLDNADDNGKAFVDYCKLLGLRPRFSGWANGSHNKAKDFSVLPGYWKTLIDRRMYNNDGTYHEQKAIDVTNLDQRFFSREESEQGIVQPSKVNDRAKTEAIAEKSAQEIAAARGEGYIRHSIADTESDVDTANFGVDANADNYRYSLDYPPANVNKIATGSFFSGGGLVDVALASIANHQFAVEYNDRISAVYKDNVNVGFMGKDVRDFDPYEWVGKIEYFHASPVCKTFSPLITNEARAKREQTRDDITTAEATAKAIRVIRPKYFTMENVRGYEGTTAFKIIEDALNEVYGKNWDKAVYNSADYGAATSRDRLFVRATLNDTLPPKPTKVSTKANWYDAVKDMIDDLPAAKTVNPRMIQSLNEISHIDVNNIDKPLFVFGESYKNREYGHAFADKPLPTIFANTGASRIFMPDGRVLEATPDVLARISGLPSGYTLPKSKDIARTIIGNGVPVQLTQAVAGSLLNNDLLGKDLNDYGTKDASGNVRYSLSKPTQADADYMSAVNRGDMETAQRMVDEAAERAGYGIKAYHGHHNEYTSFHKSAGQEGRYGSYGIYFADRGTASTYGTPKQYYLKISNPVTIDADGYRAASIFTDFVTKGARGLGAYTHIDDIASHADELGYDGVIIKNVNDNYDTDERKELTTDYIVFEPANISSADPVTYDDEGNVIPLSKRFNAQNDDIRYSIDPPADLDADQTKNFMFNMKNNEVGTALTTLAGTKIKRYKNIAGKEVAPQVYVHKNYAAEVIPAETWETAKAIIEEQRPDFQYNCVMYDRKAGTVRFDESPDFDTAREPIPGRIITVDPSTGTITKDTSNNQIWHHKWLWVKNDYDGFDVAESWNWSKQYLSTLRYVAPSVHNFSNNKSDDETYRKKGSFAQRGIADAGIWDEQLDYFGLPHDAGRKLRYSLTAVPPVQPKSDLWSRGYTEDDVRNIDSNFRKSDAQNQYVEDINPNVAERKADRIKLAQRSKAGKRGNGTQRANTVVTYDRLYDTLEKEGFDGTILDASSGLGLGTDHGIQRGFDVEDIEPFYGDDYLPIYSDYSRLDKQYDVVISSAVINVLTQESSDAMVAAIGKALKPGGRAFITVRSASSVDGSLKGGSSIRLSDNAHEWYVPGSDNYQRGFETNELKAYLEDTLGDEFIVEASPKCWDVQKGKFVKWGDTSAVVTRKSDGGVRRYSVDETGLLDDQKRTSEDTSLNQVPASMTNFKFSPTDRVLDWGGGRYDTAKVVMEHAYPGIKFEVHDPYNRTASHGDRVLSEYKKDPATVLTINNVLNVIDGEAARESVVSESKKYLADGGMAYFTIYEGDGSGVGRVTKAKGEGNETTESWQNNMKAKEYLPLIQKYYKNAKVVSNFIIASDGDLNYAKIDPSVKASMKADLADVKKQNLDMKTSRYSIEKLHDGRKYVKADRQVIFGNDPEQWSDQLEIYINKKIRNGENVSLIAEDGDILTLTKDTAGKVSSMFDNHGHTLPLDYYERKVSAGSHIDELAKVSVSRNRKNKTDFDGRHGAKASDGWNYRNAFFRDFDGKYYKTTISVQIGEDGNAVYNIGDMKERPFPDVTGSSVNDGTLNQGRSSEFKVAQSDDKVKRHSISNEVWSVLNEMVEEEINRKAKPADQSMANMIEQQGFVAGQITQAKADAKALRQAEDKLNKAQTALTVAKSEAKVAAQDAMLIGKMEQGKRDAKELRDANDKLQIANAKVRAAEDALRKAEANHKAELAKTKQDAMLVGRIEQGKQMSADLRKARDKLDAANAKVAQLKSDKAAAQQKFNQARKDATLAGQMAQGKQDAKQISKLQADIRELNAKIAKAEKDLKTAKEEADKAAKDAFLAGQMRQGRDDAAALRRSEEARAKEQQAHEAERQRRRDAKATADWMKAERKARTDLLKIANRLSKMKTTAANRSVINGLIGELDLVSVGMTQKSIQKISDLRDWYEDQKANNPNFISDPATEARIARLSKKHIKDMDISDILELTKVLQNIENQIATQQKFIDSQIKKATYEAGEQIIDDIRESPGHKYRKHDAIDWLITNELSPVRFAKRIVGYKQDSPMITLFNELADGQRNMIDYQMRASRLFDKWASDTKFTKKITGKSAERIKIAGARNGKKVTVEITPDMRMALYLHSLNDQNVEHIKEGGVRIPDLDILANGNVREAYKRGTVVKISPAILRGLYNTMSEQEKEYANAVNKYFNGMSRSEINSTSEKLVGYSLAEVENYFPINTDDSFSKREFETLKRDGTIEGMGFLKERINAKNPIMLRGMTDILEQSIRQHSKYVGLAIPVRNFSKIWGVTENAFNDGEATEFYQKEGFHDDNTPYNYEAYTDSVQNALGDMWGSRATDYVEKMMTDLQTEGGKTEELDKLLGKLRSNYAAATLNYNLGVAIKQAASYPTAAAFLTATSLSKAAPELLTSLVGKGSVDLDLIAKYTPLLWYRSQGFSTQELGDVKKQNSHLPWIFDYAIHPPKILNWIQNVDIATTRALWKAAEYDVQKNNKALAVGSDAYYRSVADLYNKVIEETQPNYTTMQRPQLLRSDSSLVQSIAMFKTQPMQNFNLMYDAVGELAAAKRSQNASAVKSAWKTARSVGLSQLVQLWVFAMMTAAWNGFRLKKDKYEDKETGDVSFGSVNKRIGLDMISGAASTLFGGAEIYNMIDSIMTGTQYYGVDAVSISAVSGVMSTIVDALKTFNSLTDDIEKGEEVDVETYVRKVWKSAKSFAKVFGVPSDNVTNTLAAAAKWGSRAISRNAIIGDYNALQLSAPYSSSGFKSDAVTLLTKAMNRGDDAAATAIREDLIAHGVFKDDDAVDAALLTRMKSDMKLTQTYKDMFKMLENGEYDEFKAKQIEIIDAGLTDIDTINSKMRSMLSDKQDKDNAFALPQNALSLISQRETYYKAEQQDKFGTDDLSGAQAAQYQEDWASTYNPISNSLKSLPGWSESAEMRQKEDEAANTYAKRMSLIGNSDGQYTEDDLPDSDNWILKANDALENYNIPVATYIDVKTRVAAIESVKDKNGESVKIKVAYTENGKEKSATISSTSVEKMAIIYSIDGLTPQQQKAMAEYMEVAKSVKGMTNTAVSNKLKMFQSREGK